VIKIKEPENSLGEMLLTPACYAHMTKMLMNIAPVCVVLEGGYHLKSLAQGVAWTLKALLGDPCPKMPMLDLRNGVKPCLIDVLNRLTVHLSDHWDCMNKSMEFHGIDPKLALKPLENHSIEPGYRSLFVVFSNQAFNKCPSFKIRIKCLTL